MADEISNSNDIIDSSDVIERIEELRTEIDGARYGARAVYENDWTDAQRAEQSADEMADDYIEDNLFDERKELSALQALQELNLYGWNRGVTLIRDSYFEEYAQELAYDIGAINRDSSWPAGCIDWERAAAELKNNYTRVDFGDVLYWCREG